MRSRLAIKVHAAMEHVFPERRVFLKSNEDTRFVRLRPVTQLAMFVGASGIVAWAIIATAVLLMDSIGSGNFREQAKRDQELYQSRLNALSQERDARAEEALAAQQRFNTALGQISAMQSELLASETQRRELETGIDVIQGTLRETMADREAARTELALLQEQQTPAEGQETGGDLSFPMVFMSDALAKTAQERDQISADAQEAIRAAEELKYDLAIKEETNDQIFRQLEEAMTISVAPLDKMFRSAGMPTDKIIEQGSPRVQRTGWPHDSPVVYHPRRR